MRQACSGLLERIRIVMSNEDEAPFVKFLRSKDKKVHQARMAGLCVILAVIAFCFFNPFSFNLSGAAQEGLRHKIAVESHDQIVLQSFRKTNGRQAGDLRYLDYEAEINFRSDGLWLSHDVIHPQLTFTFSKNHPQTVYEQLQNSVAGAIPVRVANRVKIAGTMIAQKTERGWQFVSDNSRILSGP